MSSSSLKEKHNFQCASEASLDLIKLPLKDILLSQIRPEDLFLKIQNSSLLHGRNPLRTDQRKLCYFPPPVLPDYNKFDATLLYTLIRNLCPGLMPTRGWGNEPGQYDIQVGDDIERLRLFRNNNFAHLSSAIIPDDTFKDVWKTLKSVLIRLKSHSGCSVDYVKKFGEIEYSQFRYELWEQYKDIWKAYLEIKKQTDERAIRIKGNEEVICGNSAIFDAEVEQAEHFCLPIIWQRRRGKWVEIIDPTLEKYSGSTNTRLVMSSVCKMDAMEYQAFLPDGYNQMLYSNTINLHVLGEKPFLNDLEVTTEDEEIKIHYSFGVSENSPHVQDIKWSKNGHRMDIGYDKFIRGSLHDSCLIIKSPSEDDKGKYSCTVTNAVGSKEKDIVLDVPCIAISTKPKVHFASDTTITSIVTSNPQPEKAQWQNSKNGDDFYEMDVTKSKYFGSNVSPECPRLVIPKTTFDDMLYYRLQISNKLGVNVSNIVYLKVTGSLPNITVGHETDINNRSIKLRGVVFLSDDSPDIKNIFWSKNGEKLDIQGSGGRLSGVTIDDPSLTIRNVSQDDAGKYQLTAINAVGPNDSAVISIDVPNVYIRSEKNLTGGIECLCFTVEITSNPGPCHAQWNIKSKGEETFTPLDVNAEKYQGSTNSLPHPKLVIKEKDQLKKNTYQIKVTNFVGSTVEEISDDENLPLQKQEGSMENTLYEDKGAGLKFALLNNDLANQFPVEKLKLLKLIIQSSGKVADVTSLKSADSATECLTILQDENLFSKRDVIFVQFLCKVTGCKELYEKCKDYALSQKALCCFERQIENGYTKVQFHVQGDLNNYTRENIISIVKTVAGILNCRTDEILVNGVYHSRSFMLVLSVKDIYIKKWMNLSERDCHHLTSLHIDYFILNQKIFQLESSKDLVESKIAVLDKELQFAKLCGDLAKDFPRQKFQQLRSILSDSTRKMESLMPANSVLECFAYLLEINLFSKEDVSFIQFLCKETNCEELHKKCVEYAQGQELHFFEEGIFEDKIYHSIDKTYTTYRVHQCSKCPGDTNYYCESCPCALCPQCKEKHVKDLRTIDHTVVTFHEKLNYIPTQEICVRHPSNVYVQYCEPCELPVCFHCRKHRTHRQLDVRTACKTKRQQHRGTIHTIRSEALFYRPVLLTKFKADFKTCRTKFSRHLSEMLTKAQTLKHLINKVKKDFMYNVCCDFDFKHRCLKQWIEMSRHIVNLQEYERRYEQPEFTFSALQFLSFTKTALPQIHLPLHTSQLSMTESLNKENVMESLSAIKITERGNRRIGNQCLLKMTSGAELHQCLTLTSVDSCKHISCLTSSRAWVSNDENELILTNNTGATLQHMYDLYTGGYGLHTVNSEGDLFYISKNFSINKLSKDMKKTTTFIKSALKPGCVYWSPSSGDILIGMYREKLKTGKVTRYKQSGQLTKTIQYDSAGFNLYRQPRYITENNNWDVVVSDYDGKSGAVVVTKREGEPRFFYTGFPPGSGLRPRGICTDALSQILVCDHKTHTVQIIDGDGQFLSYLLIRPSGIFYPHSLSYDVNTHRVWVGSQDNNKVVIYNYIQRVAATTDVTESLSELTTTETKISDLIPATTDVTESLSELTTTETKISATVDEMESVSELATIELECTQEGNDCQLKLMDYPALVHVFTVNDVRYCYHISFVTSDQVWVSGRKTLIMTNRAGDTLHRVEDICSDLRGVLHTVNTRCELLYIDSNYNIKKLSSDMKTATTFLKKPTSAWEPRCVYWSPSTRNLLVGMCKYRTGMITRYNQSGQQTQTIKHDNTGLELYREPNYIIELKNGDVVVSDAFSAVVVTGRGGRHRFSYTGHPKGSGLEPRGIATDALSHILVCDGKTKLIHIINKDGRFLSHLKINSSDICSPYSLCYDANTHLLWVGSGYNNELCVYRYLERMDTQIDQSIRCLDEFAFASCSSRPAWR